ncbi:TIGR03747 family integrating conjugative element membrane protein [Xenorhabdus griffiniae]|uniref:TIGR03747 family integrating conjugative element membrane protein n=1 Tax=Xenorhabdus griffiniae TaxID=351672 RepID=A0ABY9XET5_9GAMM|nr:TIGR03747 family integrating conjugative element membrane protein [Xenorhabdus griffiniae]MBD1225989.1 TIGR03747 family integrating conjugative element membrane protein [Xenorhabdus griffiniae]MBE8585893.1 TIGR03747 family integrating conjugative element membrane protein [Xenorhabdus griffiniae]WMV71437.1 TIGR03747 family integrating conjugative element membrane protein [Xenorhabdus griffiniae]WNH01114.1 TIGR03747 family integrating conjugative element membrane protein [Xenorhabdus griffinia
MAQHQQVKPSVSESSRPVKEPGVFAKVLWHFPLNLIGMLLASLLFSCIIEWIGIAFFWSEQGAEHSRQVMLTEGGYLSSEFTRSLFMSSPSQTLSYGIESVYTWLFVDSGIMAWFQSVYQEQATSNNGIVRELTGWSQKAFEILKSYLLASVFVTVTFLIRVTILVLSIPLFILVLLVAMVEGLGRRDLRRYGAGYESSFVYHHAKRFVKPAFYVPCMTYLSWPSAVYPNLLLLPAAILLGTAVTVMTASFKKYL